MLLQHCLNVNVLSGGWAVFPPAFESRGSKLPLGMSVCVTGVCGL